MKIKSIFVFAFSFFVFGKTSFAQSNFFAEDTIQIIEITFPDANWDYMMDTAKSGADGYTLATQVKINGVVFDSAGIRYKGNSSYDSTYRKDPLHIKLDYTNGNANYYGVTDVKVSNEWSDPSMVREILSYHVLRSYLDEPQSNFAKIYINGIYFGVYTSSEDISKNFLNQKLFSSDQSFFKGNPANVVTGHIPNLVYLGTDSANYYDRYEMKSDYAWKELINLCDTINNSPASLNEILDVDRTLWMLAFNDETVNLDSYSGLFAQNYYLYQDHNNRFNPIVWDLNMCFGSFTNTGTANLSITQEQQLTPLLHASNASRPLIKNLLADSTWRKMYIAHLRTMNDEYFLNGNYLTLAQNYQALIDTSVLAESYSLNTYSEFQNGLTTAVGFIPGVQQLMDARAIYLDTTSEFLQVPPAISNVTATTVAPAFGGTDTILATVTNAITSRVFLGYREKKSDRFLRIPMFDDGNHGDGNSGDDVYGISIPVNSLDIQYYIYAENNNAGMFSPERAEHEFYLLQPTIAQANSFDFVLNEYEANNTTGIVNEEGKHRDWIEIYNLTPNALGLQNFFLSDNLTNLFKWQFPATSFILPYGHLLIWADDNNANWIDLHTNFNLNNSGDTLLIADISWNTDDLILFDAQNADFAMARCPDGTGAFAQTVIPTPRSANVCAGVSVSEISHSEIVVFPNPATDELNFIFPDGGNYSVSMMNELGQKLSSVTVSIQHPTCNIQHLQGGIYFLIFTDENGNRQTKKFVKQ